MKQLFYTTTLKPLNTGNPDNSAKTVPDDWYETGKTFKLKDQRKTSVEKFNFSVLSPDENATDTMGKDISRSGTSERSIKANNSNSNLL